MYSCLKSHTSLNSEHAVSPVVYSQISLCAYSYTILLYLRYLVYYLICSWYQDD